MLPVVLAPDNYAGIFASISKRYELVASLEGIGLYKRTG
jgi:hypothetical protein